MTFPSLHRLSFVERRPESVNVYSFIFDHGNRVRWRAGQHFIFWIPSLDLWIQHNSRAFSVSSAPSEGHIRITTRYFAEKGSKFKHRLFNMKQGDRIIAFGPLQRFYLNEGFSRHCGVAGGIGITPLRSLLVQLDADSSIAPFTLFYQNARPPIIFDEELRAIATRRPNIRVIELMDPAHIDAEALKREMGDLAGIAFYVSGSPGYIKAIEVMLRGLGVNDEQITQDGFWDFRERVVHVLRACFEHKD